MPPSKDAPAVRDIDALHPVVRDEVRLIETLIGPETTLPFVIIETRRSIKRQAQLQRKGRSRTNLGAHCFGLAFDVMLLVKHPYWRICGERPLRALDGGPAPWDTGYEVDPALQSRVRLVRPGVAAAWRAFGALVEGRGLTWGGRPGTPERPNGWESSYDGNEFGWDVGHVQAKGWRSVVKRLGLRAS